MEIRYIALHGSPRQEAYHNCGLGQTALLPYLNLSEVSADASLPPPRLIIHGTVVAFTLRREITLTSTSSPRNITQTTLVGAFKGLKPKPWFREASYSPFFLYPFIFFLSLFH
ncbi:hypothetical protein GQ53DRAFT_455423 [Thozetella sp. PMI_491]|nr:hypothetical protein GQ53DRAFT_455423 [Thozetella sp. PMI_491]